MWPVGFGKPLTLHSHLTPFMVGKFHLEKECNSTVLSGVTFPHVWLVCLAQKHKDNPTNFKLQNTPLAPIPTARPDQEDRHLFGLLSSKICFLGSSGTLFNTILVIFRTSGDWWWSHFLELCQRGRASWALGLLLQALILARRGSRSSVAGDYGEPGLTILMFPCSLIFLCTPDSERWVLQRQATGRNL